MQLNKVLLIGRLTRDPELKYTAGNAPVCDLGLAINERWTGKDGQKREETVFLDVRFWNRQAETAVEYLRKGQPVLIEGKLRLDQWQTKDGEKRSKLYVLGDGWQFLASKDDGSKSAQPSTTQARKPVAPAPRPAAQSVPTTADVDSDIPF